LKVKIRPDTRSGGTWVTTDCGTSSGYVLDMERDILRDGIQIKRSEEEMDAEFEEHNLNIEEILARTQRSFASRSRRCIYEGKYCVIYL